MVKHNEPGAPANTPQHMPDQRPLPNGAEAGNLRWKHKQTGTGTAPADRDVADPHPSDEEHPYRKQRPGASRPAG